MLKICSFKILVLLYINICVKIQNTVLKLVLLKFILTNKEKG